MVLSVARRISTGLLVVPAERSQWEQINNNDVPGDKHDIADHSSGHDLRRLWYTYTFSCPRLVPGTVRKGIFRHRIS